MPSINKIRVNGTDYDLVEDTGWVNLTILSPASSISSDDLPRVRRIGKTLYFAGQFRVTNGSGTEVPLIEVPEGFRPEGVPAALGHPQWGYMYYNPNYHAFMFYSISGSLDYIRMDCTCLVDDSIESEE